MLVPLAITGEIRSFRGTVERVDVDTGPYMRLTVTIASSGEPVRGTVVDCPHCGEKAWAERPQ